jgi:hypothetical protein
MAKAKKKREKSPEPVDNPAPKKRKRSLAANQKARRARAPRSNPGPRANPPAFDDLKGVILPGFAAFAATKLLSRMAYSVVSKKFPKLGRHAHAAAGVGSFAAVWFGAHRVKQLAPYHDGIVAGAGMAALHGLAQAYLPAKYRWILGDPQQQALPASQNTGVVPPQIQGQTSVADDEFAYLEEALDRAASGDKRIQHVPAPRGSSSPVAAGLALASENDGNVNFDPDLMEELGGEDVDSMFSGVFGN